MAEFTPHEAPAREVRSLPVAVPAKLIGRDATLAEIYAHLKDNNPVHLYGMSGIGKSALAATLASAYTQQPGGVLWLNVDDAPLEQLLVRVGRAYQVTEITRSNNPVSVIGTVARTLAQHKPLIVLDGKIDYNVAAEFVNKAALRLPVLIITKDQMVDDTWKSMEIDRLRAHHSTELLVYASGIPSSSEIESLAEELDDIPYALVVAAGSIRANKTAPADFLKA
ncbi:MAG: hypothetical protein H7175_24155, partial [Burkholderiales bacterium]|nr:hypothetical protein [Anaerolineae bacterium]